MSHPLPVAELTAAPDSRAEELPKPLPTRIRRPRPLRSFIGGILIGTSISLPLLVFDVGEGGGALVLAGSLTLAAAGIGLHVRRAKQTSGRR